MVREGGPDQSDVSLGHLALTRLWPHESIGADGRRQFHRPLWHAAVSQISLVLLGDGVAVRRLGAR